MVRQGHQKPTEETIMLIEIKIINEQWSSEQISVLRNFYSCFLGGGVVIVHNGIIENYLQLKDELLNKGHELYL